MHLLLQLIFRQLHPNFRGGRNANASEIWAQLTKIILQNQAQKDSERTLSLKKWIFCVLFIRNVIHLEEAAVVWFCRSAVDIPVSNGL